MRRIASENRPLPRPSQVPKPSEFKSLQASVYQSDEGIPRNQRLDKRNTGGRMAAVAVEQEHKKSAENFISASVPASFTSLFGCKASPRTTTSSTIWSCWPTSTLAFLSCRWRLLLLLHLIYTHHYFNRDGVFIHPRGVVPNSSSKAHCDPSLHALRHTSRSSSDRTPNRRGPSCSRD